MENKEIDIYQSIRNILVYIGEDPDREGLQDTPKRIVKSWTEIYAGYGQDPKDLLTVFEETANYSQMVLLKDIEIYSSCEHHNLPFLGVAHVAYIPNGKVIGISKLARLVDIFAKRMQIQERLCEQITDALMEHLQPKGAACQIQAQHLCMQMRGVRKQNSVMVTTSLKGVFLDNSATREEFLQSIK